MTDPITVSHAVKPGITCGKCGDRFPFEAMQGFYEWRCREGCASVKGWKPPTYDPHKADQ